MSILKLIDPTDGSYFSENHLGRDTLLYFLHIPKTAGSSFGVEMRSRLTPNYKILIDYGESKLPIAVQRHMLFANFLAMKNRQRLRFVSGHIPFQNACTVALAAPNVRFVTFLRDPMARIISDYRYQLSDAHPLHAKFAASYPNFGSYIEHRGANEKMYHFLCLYRGESVEDVISRMERTFMLVGTLEHYELCFEIVTALIGKMQKPSVETNKGDSKKTLPVAPSNKEIQRVREKNPNDYRIYQHFQNMLSANETIINGKLKQQSTSGV